ncbi:D-alanyl-D-alanine carboxypeptidase [Psychrobacter frigidicola]|uniref:D-alanyl-D-alanine carboxypeptidase n=1 Tax=Psychrobacter frigidicola TaxID=45611 RepID=A0A5C7A558_9GAMM|nr:D-alanyl-D-alanine carboxypeptidase [Psychrobacter frigidicola]TXD98551.1 D-alanyl-D-alanine carboxypeptidase [Psychrobacter frigidicola]
MPILPNTYSQRLLIPVSTRSSSTRTSNRLPLPRDHNGRLFKLGLLCVLMTLTPIGAQAVLPANIQAALTRAVLTPADISIIITPVGEKNTSRLPPIIEVIDSANLTTSTDHIVITSSSAPTTTNTKPHKQTSANVNSVHKKTESQNTPIVISKQEIAQQERKLHAYTDDTYTYKSIENPPSILPARDIASTNSPSKNSSSKSSLSTTSSTITVLKPLISHQPNIARTPASTMKLIPSFIALDTLGADFVWHTRVYHSGIIIGNRLHGDLIIQGSGDPKMTHDRLQQLLYQVQNAGIRHIDGDIIIDSTIFSNVTKNPAAFDNAPLRPYNASPDGFLVNFSSMGIQSYPLDNGQAQLTYTPQLANYQLPSLVNTRTAVCSQASYSLAPQWQTDKLTFNANLPDSCGEHVFYVAYPDAKDFAARVIAAKWQELGNTLSGKVVSQETPYDATQSAKNTQAKRGLATLPVSPLPIVSYPSLTLTQQIYDINHFSNNVMTEQVALSIAAYHKTAVTKANIAQTGTPNITSHKTASLYQFGKPNSTSYPQALTTINQWWQTHLTSPPPHLTNGSGLCRDCTVTASNLNELLTYAYHHPSFDAYVNSLGIAGVSGTIAAHSERLPESSAIGRAWIKTGTLDNVTSMAGYVKGQSGQDYVVVGLINTEHSLNTYTARPVLDALLDWTAQQ